MKWVGLTGGIATGKSTVQKILMQLQIPVIDADRISHEMTQINSAGLAKIISHFGSSLLNSDQSLNRKKLGQIVFSDATQLLALENILHPLIQDQVQKQRLVYQNQGQRLCFYDVPLLFEKGLVDQFDLSIVVYVPRSIQIERLRARNNLSDVEALQRIQAQWPIDLKIAKADFCLDNSTTLEDLQLQITTLLKHL